MYQSPVSGWVLVTIYAQNFVHTILFSVHAFCTAGLRLAAVSPRETEGVLSVWTYPLIQFGRSAYAPARMEIVDDVINMSRLRGRAHCS